MDAARNGIAGLLAGRRAVVVGVGNSLCADDGAGPYVARRLAAEHPGRALDAGTVPENHLGVVLERAPEVVLFVDAVDHGGAPGDWCVVPVWEAEARVSFTHAASLRLAATLLESEGAACWLVGIQPACLEPGRAMGAAVRESADRLAAVLARALAGEPIHA